MKRPDVCIAGAGIIGLTLALALDRRNVSVLVLSAGDAMAEASTAAAGMLAVEDPENPPQLLALARFSRSLYPALLASLNTTATQPVSFQTHRTLQALPSTVIASPPLLQSLLRAATPSDLRVLALEEQSLDPRELAPALLTAIASSRVHLQTTAPVLSTREVAGSVHVHTASGEIQAGLFVDCTGAWSLSSAHVPSLRIVPRKGQMLTVPTPRSLAAGIVLRSPTVYMVPRLHGPRAGKTVVGATIEDAGFDRSIDQKQLHLLLEDATTLLPELRNTPILESWSGLRPATADLLPALGPLPGSERLFIASGHYRNGILLAPGTAEILAQCILGEAPALPLDAFSPGRFAGS